MFSLLHIIIIITHYYKFPTGQLADERLPSKGPMWVVPTRLDAAPRAGTSTVTPTCHLLYPCGRLADAACARVVLNSSSQFSYF